MNSHVITLIRKARTDSRKRYEFARWDRYDLNGRGVTLQQTGVTLQQTLCSKLSLQQSYTTSVILQQICQPKYFFPNQESLKFPLCLNIFYVRTQFCENIFSAKIFQNMFSTKIFCVPTYFGRKTNNQKKNNCKKNTYQFYKCLQDIFSVRSSFKNS
jgi:hypothetical protein